MDSDFELLEHIAYLADYFDNKCMFSEASYLDACSKNILKIAQDAPDPQAAKRLQDAKQRALRRQLLGLRHIDLGERVVEPSEKFKAEQALRKTLDERLMDPSHHFQKHLQRARQQPGQRSVLHQTIGPSPEFLAKQKQQEQATGKKRRVVTLPPMDFSEFSKSMKEKYAPKPKPEPRPRRSQKGTMADARSTYNEIMKSKGWEDAEHAREMVYGKGWSELNEKVRKHFGLEAGRDYRNWKQMITKMRERSANVQSAGESAQSKGMKVVKPKAREQVEEQGTATLNTKPWSKVYLESPEGQRKFLGDTPLVNVKLPAGKNRLLFYNPDTKQKFYKQVTVEPGKPVEMQYLFRPKIEELLKQPKQPPEIEKLNPKTFKKMVDKHLQQAGEITYKSLPSWAKGIIRSVEGIAGP